MIGRVLKVKENTITLGWLIGGYKRAWSDCLRTGKHLSTTRRCTSETGFVENKGIKVDQKISPIQ